MPAVWRLATSSFWRRRGRTLLLIACVALCSALVASISCAIESVNNGVQRRLDETVGAADVRIVHIGKGNFPDSVLRTVRNWPEVSSASGRVVESVVLANPGKGKDIRATAWGVMPAEENRIRPQRLLAGSLLPPDPAARAVVLDQRTAAELDASLGDKLTAMQFGGDPIELTLVGIVRPPPLSGFIGAQSPAYFPLETLRAVSGNLGTLNEIEVTLARPDEAEAFAKNYAKSVPEPLVVQPTARAGAIFQANRRTSQIGLLLASVFALLAAAFIIATGMTTAVAERTRELSILRCIGATRTQIAGSQLLVGLFTGLAGACIGAPLGIVIAGILVLLFPDQLPGGFGLSASGVATAAVGAVLAGVLGAAWPAVSAARVTPLQGLASRSGPTRPWLVWAMAVVGLVLIGVQATIVGWRIGGVGENGRFFWYYVPVGIPCMLTGYFLLGVPVMRLVSAALAAPLGRLLALPPRMLGRTLAQTPYRHGFTAASMMLGLAMLISIWTNGRSILDNWLDKFQFPDAFITGLSMRADTADRVRNVPGVAEACAITLQNVDADAFGIKGLTRYRTTFIAFEPDSFFRLMKIDWVQGDPQGAIARLKQGGAILVAKEFLVTRNMGVGSKIKLRDAGRTHEFEIVGVVTSPGLDIASKFLDIGEGYIDQAVNAVFGTRADLRERFANDAINMVQYNFQPGADTKAVRRAVERLPGTGMLAGVSAVELREKLHAMLTGTLRVFSFVAVGAMVIASFGVANIIIAGVQARAYQFGVLRAVGASRGMLGRLVLAEALLIGLAAAVLGTGLGLQAAWGGQTITGASIGIELAINPPAAATAWSWLAVISVTVLAAAPTAARLVRRQPRELLSVVKG